ncbi:putative alcohol dehydrogenase [Xylariomycetidae sp. FL0641]|nr:putative alcohol dehydrogenase [Xylariomycetidae sp. FL0641]
MMVSVKADTRNGNAASGRWVLTAPNGLDSLKWDTSPAEEADLGPEDVLVDIRAASLNYRDLVVAQAKGPSPVPLPLIPDLVPGSDGAGRIAAVGSAVAALRPELQVGTDVMMHMVPHIADDAMPGFEDIGSGLGQQTHGTLRKKGVFHHSTLLPKPGSINYVQAATMGCSGLTAWNALFGPRGYQVKEGDWVLVQGTGGVSVAALQIAVAAGATVVATTSSDAKAERLQALGAAHVLNYKTQSDWGVRARELTPNGRGFDLVIDVGGTQTLPQSLQATCRDGMTTVVGILGASKEEKPVDMMGSLWHLCAIRGILLGSRNMFRDFANFVEEKKVAFAVDDIEFTLEDAKKAYERVMKQQHFAKVVIKVD